MSHAAKYPSIQPNNYRPIAITSVLSKVMDSIRNSHLLVYLEDHTLDTRHSTAVRFRKNFLSRAMIPGRYDVGTFKKCVYLYLGGDDAPLAPLFHFKSYHLVEIELTIIVFAIHYLLKCTEQEIKGNFILFLFITSDPLAASPA